MNNSKKKKKKKERKEKENNRTGKNRDLFKIIGDIKGIFHARMA